MNIFLRKKRFRNNILTILVFIIVLSFTGCNNGSDCDTEEVKVSGVDNSFTEATEVAYTSSNLAVPSVNGKLHVEGTNLVDENNQPVQLRGLSTHGIAWFPQYVNSELFGELKDNFHINVIRLAMYTSEYGGYSSGGDKEELRQLVRDGVNYATENDMYLIIDWHILSDSNPNINKADAIEFFDEMSKEFADYDNVIYEICNEPNGSTTWAEIKSYAEEVIGVIRANDDDAVIIVGTPTWSQGVDKAVEDPISDYDNIMYALHFYAGTHKDDLRNTAQSAIDSGLPIFVSEFGICDASGNGAIDTVEAEKWIKFLNDNNVSYVAWNISNKDETSAIFKPSVTKTSGFNIDDLSESGKWLFEMFNEVYKLDETSTGFTKIEDEKDTSGYNPEGSGVGVNQEEVTNDKNFMDNEIGSGDFSVIYNLANSWESNGEKFYQYDITIKNISDKTYDSWEVDIPFDANITLHDNWNGEYSVNGDVVHIKSKDYNGSIEPKESVDGIGFIVSGGEITKYKE